MKHLLLFMTVMLGLNCHAGDVTIVNAEARKTGEHIFSFNVTLKHTDTGWDHYADQWQVLSPDGEVLGTRTLYHPHVEEQPFTRSLGNVKIPKNINSVEIKAHDKVHGVGPQRYQLDLSR